MMKVSTVIFVILIAIIAYSFFDYYLVKGTALKGFRLQANISQTESEQKKETSQKEASRKETPEIIQEQETETNSSPPSISSHYEKVKISRVQAKSYYRPSLVTLTIRPKYGDKINITGWKIKTRQGEFIIPKGVEEYQSHISPRNIIVKDYLVVYLIGDKNPLRREDNFRLNKCFGYIKSYQNIYPSFNTNCPRQKLEDVSHLGPYCQEFILGLSSCEIPNYSNNLRIATDSQCVAYINDNFNYSQCFDKYSKDEDFLLDYWPVFTKTDIVQELHDTVYLYDQNNLLVDKYIY